MFGIVYSSLSMTELIINRSVFHVCPIGIYRPPKHPDKGYNPTTEFENFMREKSGGRTRCVLVHGYNTLGLLPNDENIKYIVFDAPQILAKAQVDIFDASQPVTGSGVWEHYKNGPKELNKKIQKTPGGYVKLNNIEYSIRYILGSVCEDLEEPKKFKKLVAKYIFGLLNKETWTKKIQILKDIVSKEKYELLMSWLDTFAPDALCLAYMDCLTYAPKRCKIICDYIIKGNKKEIYKKKFFEVAKKACLNSSADYEDFLYLVRILPPSSEYSDKFLVPMPAYLVRHRKLYPLIKTKDSKELSKIDKNT